MPLLAIERSLEKATTGTLEACAAGAMARTELERRGPKITDAPSLMAKRAALAAPSGFPLVSWGNNSKRESAKSNNAN